MEKTKNWLKIRINSHPDILETISPLLFELGCSGLEESSESFVIYFDEVQWNNNIHSELLGIISRASPGFEQDQLDIEKVPAKNWMDEWKKGFHSFKVTDSLVVKPDWEQIEPEQGRTVITITPKMAFGTGHHESTRLILTLLKEYMRQGYSVLDLGTGSGILAIYAAKLDASDVLAVDNDPEAYDNFKENIELNNCSDKITGMTGTLENIDEKEYDLILANINRNVLLELPKDLINFISNAGYLILAGILETDEQIIKQSYASEGWYCIDTRQENEWLSMVFQHL